MAYAQPLVVDMKLRAPVDLAILIRNSAQRNNRSINAEMIYQLEKAYEKDIKK